MIRKILYLLVFIATNVAAQTPDTMLVKPSAGAGVLYEIPSLDGLTFSGVQGKDTLNVNLKSGSSVQYSISLLDSISFSENQSVDSIFIEFKEGTVRKYAISSISHLSFIGWDQITSTEPGKPLTEKENNLGQNLPNPFHTFTTIPYYVPEQQNVILTVATTTGKIIATLVKEQQSAGIHRVTWDASAVPGGIYVYRLQLGEYIETKKMILLK